MIRKLKDYVIDDIQLFVQCDLKLFHELSFLLDFSLCFINSLASSAVITISSFTTRGYSVELEENIHINLRPGYTKQLLPQLAT